MKSEKIIIIVLIVILFIGIIFGFCKYKQLNNEISILSESNQNLLSEREQLLKEREDCRLETNGLKESLNLLQEDVFKIKKSCLTENVCKNRFPGVRYKCNDLGEAHDDGTKLCECTDNCEVQFD
ncbi:MAG: hypothetical protein PHG05_01000 [Candidatus Nanoarchaeia archaeon]|nr:hypothetical protein [Candidatus Nanoarchaeia archaeon]